MIYTSTQSFKILQYGDEAIERLSDFYTVQVDPSTPKWVDTQIMMNQIQDEVSFLQYG